MVAPWVATPKKRVSRGRSTVPKRSLGPHCVADLFLLCWAVSNVNGGWQSFWDVFSWFVALSGQRIHDFYDYIMPKRGLRFGQTKAQTM